MGSPVDCHLLGFGAQERGPWSRADRQTCPGKGDQLLMLPLVTLGELFYCSGP